MGRRGREALREGHPTLGTVGRDLTGEDGEHEKEQQHDRADPRLAIVEEGLPDVAAPPAFGGPVRDLDAIPVLGGDGSVVSRHIVWQWVVRVGWLDIALLDGLSRPWVEDRREYVAGEHAEQDGDGDEQEQGLHERVVEALHRREQEVPEARVVEDVLDEDGARHHEAERHGEAREIGEDGVPSRRRPT